MLEFLIIAFVQVATLFGTGTSESATANTTPQTPTSTSTGSTSNVVSGGGSWGEGQ
jgi:hypothetical protein